MHARGSPLQDKGLESPEEKDGAGYRAVLYTCVAAHWVTLLTAVAVAGTLPVTPLALLGACHVLSTPQPARACLASK